MERRLLTLHRHFLAASLAKETHDAHLRASPPVDSDSGLDLWATWKMFALAGWWFSALWVVLDGWGQLGIVDADIERVKSDPAYRKLKDFRDATMHYRPELLDMKLMNFLSDEEALRWVRQAHKIMSAGLERELTAHRGSPLPMKS